MFIFCGINLLIVHRDFAQIQYTVTTHVDLNKLKFLPSFLQGLSALIR